MSSFSRLWQIRKVIRKHQLGNIVNELKLTGAAKTATRLLLGSSKPSAKPRGQRIREALEELGPVFVKLGQALSTRPDLLPDDVAEELTKLQDQVPPFSAQESMRIIQAAYGDELDSIFASIDPEPLASASVAQVHTATLQDGLAIAGQKGDSTHNVIIKVLRPNIREVVDKDIKVMYTLAGLLDRYWPRSSQFKPLEVVKEYDVTIHDELDLRVEAANGSRMGANFEESDLIYVPRIYWDYTKQNILVMERIEGLSIREIPRFKELGYDLKSLAEDGVHTFFKQAFEDNFFHADMHAGNIFVSSEGKWIAIDFGIMGTLTDEDKRYLGEILLGFFNRDYNAIARAHIRAGWVPSETRSEEFEQAICVVCEPIFAKPLSEISFGRVLVQLFQTVRRFEMPVQPQLVLLYKTLLNIEGLGRQLYPQLNLWDTAKPFLEEWMKEQYSAKTLLAELQQELPAWQRAIRQLPKAIETLARQSSREEKENTKQKRAQIAAAALTSIAICGNFVAGITLSNPLLPMVGLSALGIFGIYLLLK